MTTWIKPVTGWGATQGTKLCGSFYSDKPEANYHFRPIRVAVIPYTVARKAGLLRRPK